jgi:3-dehydroquinate dehydratase-2
VSGCAAQGSKEEKSMNIYIVNGPNLNLLGLREPEIYGDVTLEQVERDMRGVLSESSDNDQAVISFYQSNHEGELVDYIQNLMLDEGKTKIKDRSADAIIINAGALTHSSIALHDALKNFNGRIIEVHVSNPMARETFRHTSYIAPLAEASICGFGAKGYLYALDFLLSSQ